MRKPGTGSVFEQASGTWSANQPAKRGRGKSIGSFPSKAEAEAALDQWLVDNPQPEKPARSPRSGGHNAEHSAENRAVANYLEALRLKALGKSEAIGIGRAPGLPATSTDPEVVDQAAAYWLERASQEASILKELELRARARRLAEGAERLRAQPDLEAAFVAHAAAYGKRKGVEWPTWREMGVPAEVLRSAGITP